LAERVIDIALTPRFRFGEFVLSRAQRRLIRNGADVPLIPRYFDLLALLVSRRHEALHRNLIRDCVWSDVIVTDGAVAQAVRTLRRALDDDPRAPRFIRTVSRHGYQFVYADVVEEEENVREPTDDSPAIADGATAQIVDASVEKKSRAVRIDRAVELLLAPGADGNEADLRREAAEVLHSLSTTETLRRLDRRPGHARARALLRDTRWDVPGAVSVPILGQPDALAVAWHLVRLRIRRLLHPMQLRWLGSAMGGGLAGVAAGLIGGIVLVFGPDSNLTISIPVVLAALGGVVGALGAAGVGAGLAVAEAVTRSMRSAALILGGAIGGGLVAAFSHLLARWTLTSLFGHDPTPLGGGLEGLVVGAGAGLGYALTTENMEGLATPRRWRKLATALMTGAACAAAAILLAMTGHHLGAMSVDVLARSFPGSQMSLDPLARLLGEAVPGSRTRIVISGAEGFFFGAGLALGLTRRPRTSA
jgi:DNA-binding winged helix-turn-helix (wHTH) protein